MIVKNNGRMIERCLESVVPYVNEVIIVDTGSTDDTKEKILGVYPGTKLLDFTPETHPKAFLKDSPESWKNKIPGPFTTKMFLADFAAARNHGWREAKSDFLFWMDSDDVLEGGENLAGIVADMEKMRFAFAHLMYDYEYDHHGNVICRLQRERIARRSHGSYWVNPVHEVILPLGASGKYDNVVIKHLRREYKEKLKQPADVQCRNLKILSAWFQRTERDKDIDPRMLYYLVTEEQFVKSLWDMALEHGKRYCSMSGWDEERSVCREIMGTIYERMGKLPEAFAEFCQAAVEAPWRPEGWFGAARCAYYKKTPSGQDAPDWAKVIDLTEAGFDVMKRPTHRQPMMQWNPMDREWHPYVYYSGALVATRQFEKAIAAANKGLEKVPTDPHLLGNKQFSEKAIAEAKAEHAENSNKPHSVNIRFRQTEPLDSPASNHPAHVIVHFAIQLWKHNMGEGNYQQALVLLDALPDFVKSSAKIKEAREMTEKHIAGTSTAFGRAEKREPGRDPLIESTSNLRIVIWAGQAWEKWTPKSLETGIGGSETAAICMSRELAKLGHRVRVIGDPREEAGRYDGVEYVRWDDALKDPDSHVADVFISSRQPLIFLEEFRAFSRFIWAHDIHVGHPSPGVCEALFRADKIFALSDWHRQYMQKLYPFIHPDTFITTRNGIDVARFKERPPKQNRLIFASSPDRGLMKLLDLLPRIRAEVPDVETHVYYGFHTWEKMAEADPSRRPQLEEYKQQLKLAESLGVVFHGRVGQKELAEGHLLAKVWAYPTWFEETSCITAMEAQAAGTVPVTTNLAALAETVKHGILLPPPEGSDAYADAFVSSVVALLKNEEVRSKIGDSGRRWALANLGWDKLASEWESIFMKVIEQKRTLTPLTPYADELIK